MTDINYNLPYIASRAESELESRRLGKPSGSDSTITLLVFLSEAAEGISLGQRTPTLLMEDVIAEYHSGIIPKKMIDIEDETERENGAQAEERPAAHHGVHRRGLRQ